MILVTDTWGTNLNPAPKTFKMYKTLSATAVSGESVGDTGNMFTKDCPFPVDIIGVEVHAVSISGGGFNGAGSALTIAVQSSDEVDTSPASPTSVGWDSVATNNSAGTLDNQPNKLLWSAPSNVSGVQNVSMNKDNVSIPKGGSLRTTLACQAENAIGVSGSTPVEFLVIVECVPTVTRDQRYF